MKIYTRSGDDGSTSLSGGKRLPKSNIRIDALGSVEELIAWVGMLRSHKENADHYKILVYIQDQLMSATSMLAADDGNRAGKQLLPDKDCVTLLEHEIDKMEASLPSLKSFLVPGGNIIVSHCHIARCVCRRAERAVVNLKNSEYIPGIIPQFLNRLSDYLFVLSRLLSLELDNEEIKWPL